MTSHSSSQYVSPETHEFVKKVFEKSGIDKNGSYLPKNLHPQHTDDPKGGLDESFAEARLVMGGAVEEVIQKTGKLVCYTLLCRCCLVYSLLSGCIKAVALVEVECMQPGEL